MKYLRKCNNFHTFATLKPDRCVHAFVFVFGWTPVWETENLCHLVENISTLCTSISVLWVTAANLFSLPFYPLLFTTQSDFGRLWNCYTTGVSKLSSCSRISPNTQSLSCTRISSSRPSTRQALKAHWAAPVSISITLCLSPIGRLHLMSNLPH